jgi:hypothetical protein
VIILAKIDLLRGDDLVSTHWRFFLYAIISFYTGYYMSVSVEILKAGCPLFLQGGTG